MEVNSWFIMWGSHLPRQVSKTFCCLLLLALFQTCIPACGVKESEHLNISSNSYGCVCLCVIVKCESLSGANMSWLPSHPSVRGFCIRGGMCDQCTREESLRLQNPSLVFSAVHKGWSTVHYNRINYILTPLAIKNNVVRPLFWHFLSFG